MRVNVLGPLEVDDGERPIEIGGARLRKLLLRLALEPGRLVTTEALARALWPQEAPADQANALQSLVSRLRRALPDGVLASLPGGYRLDVSPEAVDAIRFERLAREGHAALRDGEATLAAQLLTEAEALWRGPLEHPRLAELRLSATEDRFEAELLLGKGQLHVAELEELTAANPLRERLGELLIRALAGAGRQAEALAAYERLRKVLADELGTDPSPELRALHVQLLRGDAWEVAQPRRKGNLRSAYTSFVGRQAELARIGEQLAAGRLVTLVGPGGAGKTRLATTAGEREAELAEGGVWLAELAPVIEPEEVVTAVLRALDVRESRFLESGVVRSRDLTGRLIGFLGDVDALLILDNCEHVLDAAARLADELLSRCPRLRILATSREPLGLLGEALCPVAPLRLPEPDANVAEALDFPVVQLLRDRAEAGTPGFAVTGDNVASIIEICRRLDGLPLAVELAAARLRTMPAEQVADRLDDRFRLLTGGSRAAMPRHRTLRAVVAWSWELLTADERRLAERLSIYPGGVTADSAPAPRDLLDALADKSLLQTDPTGTRRAALPAGRYRMLETIREYGLERLADAGEIADARAAHAAYFLKLAEEAEPGLRTGEQLRWIVRLEAEHDNLTAALQFACDSGDADTALRLGAALSLYWTIHGEETEAVEWLGRALRTPGPAPEEARAVCTALHLIYRAFGGELFIGPELVVQVREQLGDLDPAHGHPLLALIEPMLAMFADDSAVGMAAIERAMSHPDPWARAMLLSLRGNIKENDGDAEGMLRDLSAAAALFRGLGERWGLATTLTALADAYSKRGDLDAAAGALEEAIQLARELNPDDEANHQRVWLASLQARAGRPGAREQLLRISGLQRGPRTGRHAAFALLALGDLARDSGDLDEAEDFYQAAWERLAEATMVGPQLRGLLLAGLAHIAVGRGEYAEARTAVTEALRLAQQAKDMPVTAHIAVATVALRLAEGSPLEAAEVLGATEALRGVPDRSNADAVRLAQQLRAVIGDAAFTSAYARGTALGQPEALALATP
jgi:predicted ATPase/DNA-binding SARP family transcriptional activator